MEGINTETAHPDLVSFASVKRMYYDAKSTLQIQPHTNHVSRCMADQTNRIVLGQPA